jgi:SHS2 domain-containing protein
MYETFEHTADLGLRVRAATLDALFADAASGLFSVLVEDVDAIRPEREVTIRIDGREKDYLLFDWLNELLFRFETDHVLFSEFTVTVEEGGLSASARGEPVDLGRHRLSHEVKAVTYHHLNVEQTADGWSAEVIVDI